MQSGPGDIPALLAAHVQVMERLLDTHRRVIAAALGNGEPPQVQAKSPLPLPLVTAAIPAVRIPPPPPVAVPPPPAPEPVADLIRQTVLKVVGERTGYPPDMLDLDADLEADLGIDSIKRVEIAGRLRKAFPHLGATPDVSTAGNLSSLKTLRGLIERIESVPATGSGSPANPEAALPAGPVSAPSRNLPVPRFMLQQEEAPATAAPQTKLPHEGVFLITDDEAGLAQAVAEAIREQGSRAMVVSAQTQTDFSTPQGIHQWVTHIRKTEGRIAGMIHLLPLRRKTPFLEMSLAMWHQTLQEEVKFLFYLAQAAAEDLKQPAPAFPGWILAAVEAAENEFPGHGGFPGLVSTLAAEWPGLTGRTLALSSTDPIPTRVQQVMAELQCHDATRFARYHLGRRQRLCVKPAELDPSAGERMHIGPDWVILITGGACGITAQVAMALAEGFKPTLILTGRSALPPDEEAGATRGVESPGELRRILAAQLAGTGQPASMAMIEAAFRRLSREREMRTTLAALRKAGARATYVQADVRDPQSFGETIKNLYTLYGRLDGVIYGAGVIEDKRVEDKTPESFDRVFDTKADGAFILEQHLQLDSLKFLVFFSSVAALGNAGQSDYAAANGVLNALARDLDRRMTGRAVALLWGPWQSAGMASEDVQRQLQERGVQIIAPAEGRKCLLKELLYGHKGDVEILLGDAPYASAPSIPATPKGV